MTFIKEQSNDDQILIENINSCECDCVNITVDTHNKGGISACLDADISSALLPCVISA